MKIQGTIAQRSLLRSLRTLVDGDAVLRMLTASGDRQLPGMIVEVLESDDWASLTFVGELHRIGFRLDGGGDAVEGIRARLDQLLVATDFVMSSGICAEIALTEVAAAGRGVAVVVEALTLND